MRAAACVRGRATGTREIDALDPRHLVERIDGVLITGGSAHGLGAADGVMRWLRERGRGLPVGPVTVPIVPAAVIFDLGNAGKPVGWPGPEDAYRACEQANADVAEGRIGAGTGARSEEHTSELQSRLHLVCRLLLEKKKKQTMSTTHGRRQQRHS